MKYNSVSKALMYDYWCQSGYQCGWYDAEKGISDYESALSALDVGAELCDEYKKYAESAFYDGYSNAQDDYQADSSL